MILQKQIDTNSEHIRAYQSSHFTGSAETPHVQFYNSDHVLLIHGRSTKRLMSDFYDELNSFLENYLREEDDLTIFIHLISFNASTAKGLFDLFRICRDSNKDHGRIKIHWMCSWHEAEIIEAGMDFAELFNLHISVVPISDGNF